MTIDFYRLFAKKENSTKQPDSGVIKVSLNGRLRDGCSVVHPIIDIEPMGSGVFAPSIYTYAHISGFNRYYFVQDWRWNNGLWTVVLNEDILASYKTAIGAQTCYVLRHDSVSDYNEDITDITYPATTKVITDTDYLQNVFTDNITQGCYILGIISNETTESVGAITYYVMTHEQLGKLKSKLLTDDNLNIMGFIDAGGTPLTDIPPQLLKTLYNPYQYIASCMWFPFTSSVLESMSTSVDKIPMGWWTYPCPAHRIYANVYKIAFGESSNVFFHPQSDRGWYLNFAPYTRRMLRGRFGQVVLDPEWFQEESEDLGITYNIDIITGQCLAEIGTQHREGSSIITKKYTERSFLLGVPIQLAQIGVDYIGTGLTAVNTISSGLEGAVKGFLSSGTITGAISSAASGVYNTIQSAMPQMETTGDNGSFIAAGHLTEMITQYYLIADEDIHHKGRPLCQLRQLDTLSGFILCADGEIDIDCFDEEKTAIARYLTTGFFWE